MLFGFDGDTVYLSPAPLYHSAPLAFTTATQALGGTAVVMERFDAGDALRFVERYRVTHSQWVPTMFVRLLKLPAEERERSRPLVPPGGRPRRRPLPRRGQGADDRVVGPGAATSTTPGPRSTGSASSTRRHWLEHPGSVGQSILGTIHICDETGAELPTGETGTIYFERDEMPFEYHNDPGKTQDSQHPEHPNWSTLGDVGYVDEEGFLYLTDRKAFMIISGGVNIYPQEIEDVS